MKLSLPALLMVFVGALLIYSAKVDDDPRNVIFGALNIKRRVPHKKAASGDGKKTSEFGNVPDQGYSNVPHNAQGYPLSYTPPGTTVVSV